MSLLTDAAIDQIAREYVPGRYDALLVPVRLFHLRRPDGVFFRLGDPHAKRPETGMAAFGDAGFFIHRHDGTIRQFDPGDFSPVYRKPSNDLADEQLVAAVGEALVHLS